ncbi:MAG: hypothetical protein QM765_33415 [Myxococcales bacterium]
MAGVIYGHLFENPKVGADRGLYWAISVPFEKLDLGDEEARPLLQCEWLTWPVGRWQELAGKTLALVKDPKRVEASFYVHDHSNLELEVLEISARKRGVGLEVFLRGRVDYLADNGTVNPFPLEARDAALVRRGPHRACEPAQGAEDATGGDSAARTVPGRRRLPRAGVGWPVLPLPSEADVRGCLTRVSRRTA